jgi:hypothetical protein
MLLLGRLSAVKACGGTLAQSSKSSGTRRLMPIDDVVGKGPSVVRWPAVAKGDALVSGVLTLGTEGPATGDREEDGGYVDSRDARGSTGRVASGMKDVGSSALGLLDVTKVVVVALASSFDWSFWTFFVREATLVSSDFFCFMKLQWQCVNERHLARR